MLKSELSLSYIFLGAWITIVFACPWSFPFCGNRRACPVWGLLVPYPEGLLAQGSATPPLGSWSRLRPCHDCSRSVCESVCMCANMCVCAVYCGTTTHPLGFLWLLGKGESFRLCVLRITWAWTGERDRGRDWDRDWDSNDAGKELCLEPELPLGLPS